MNDSIIHPRLQQDCFVLGELPLSFLLLMNNALVPWFILVPRTSAREFFELDELQQTAFVTEINAVSGYVKDLSGVSKLNVAAIGNVVEQLHVHIVGRNPEDYCWPGVVWGREEKKPYDEAGVTEIRAAVRVRLGRFFSETPS